MVAVPRLPSPERCDITSRRCSRRDAPLTAASVSVELPIWLPFDEIELPSPSLIPCATASTLVHEQVVAYQLALVPESGR